MEKYFKRVIAMIESMLISYYSPAPVITHSISTGNAHKNMGMSCIKFSQAAVDDSCDY